MNTLTIIKKINNKTNKFKKNILKNRAGKKFSPKAFGILKSSFNKKKSTDTISKLRKEWR